MAGSAQVDGRKIGEGVRGWRTIELQKAYMEWADSYAERSKEIHGGLAKLPSY
jgi:hypothetical protein